MPPVKRKPAAKKAPAPVEQPAPQDEPLALKPAQDLKLEMPVGVYEVPGDTPPENLTVEWVREHGTFRPLPKPEPVEEHSELPDVRTNLDEITEQPEEAPEPSEKVRKLAHAVRTRNGTRGQRFEPEPGVVLMFGYSGLSRVYPGNSHVHIATVAELDVMSPQQIYDAVMQAGVRR